ncbi:MAG: bifunctional 5,10-methylenetetrahydrofolate dehydrogenase/5,10-methenyltetrahydrofolate cyclohydrolase, partial [Calditrichia bacterium]
MKARLIDGKAIAAQIRQEIGEDVERIRQNGGTPGLAVILVGDDPASHVYVRQKNKACEKAGIYSVTEHLPTTISEEELLAKVNQFNRERKFHGLLVQLPLPAHIDSQKVIETVAPQKDVDCFHPFNVGRLAIGKPQFEPATPAGIVELLARSDISPAGKHVVIVGRSNIVGKPLANLL